MEFLEIYDIIEENEPKRQYKLKNNDHGYAIVQELLDLPEYKFREYFRMNQQTFIKLSEKVINYL